LEQAIGDILGLAGPDNPVAGKYLWDYNHLIIVPQVFLYQNELKGCLICLKTLK
jgi:hypothetical protein